MRLRESILSLNINSLDSMKPNPLNFILFQDHLPIPPIEMSLIILSVFRNGYLPKPSIQIYRLVFMPSLDFLYSHHTLFIPKHSYSLFIWCLIEA